jgi:hypothetical protein
MVRPHPSQMSSGPSRQMERHGVGIQDSSDMTSCLVEIGVHEAFAVDYLARADRNRGGEHWTGRYEGVEFTALAAAVYLCRELCDGVPVELTTGEATVELRGIETHDSGPQAGSQHLVEKRGRGPLPQRK